MSEVHEVPSRPRTKEFSQQVGLFSAKVRAARLAKGWSHLRLAEESGISYRQVQNIEGNQNNEQASEGSPQPANPKLDTVYLLARALDLDIAYLVDPGRDVEVRGA